ncbi:hypothetical protein KP509_36G022800 [Ceratopteris richardii]|uniref:RING-type domain-containing protein n=1 Tax=Ceratopteris richardii TaxID=49495 RepID=A0A8T2QA44_CERRI|nr:hypothetical protein KP509_36G022800 [Ceratopteris richardii]
MKVIEYGRRAELRGVEYIRRSNRPPMRDNDKNIVLATAGMLGILIFLLCFLCFLEWLRGRRRSGKAAAIPAGMTQLQLEALPSALYGSACNRRTVSTDKILAEETTDSSTEKSSPPDCPICISGFTAEDLVRVLPPCQHIFHVTCVDPWLSLRSSCPTCREEVQLQPPPLSRQAAHSAVLEEVIVVYD